MRQRLRSEKGFTLIELVVVMAILLILAAFVIPSYLGFGDRANKNAAAADVRAAVSSVEAWHLDHGTYTGMTLAALKASYDQSLDASIVSLARCRIRPTRHGGVPTIRPRRRPRRDHRHRSRSAPPVRKRTSFTSDREGAGDRALVPFLYSPRTHHA